MTLKMHAGRKKWPLIGTRVHLRHQSETVDGTRVDRIVREIELEGPELTIEQRSHLLEVANLCPVHKALHRGFEIDTVEHSA